MGIGIGQYLTVGVAAALVLIVLWAIPLLQRLTKARQTLTYEVLTLVEVEKHRELQMILQAHNLQVSKSTMAKEKNSVRYLWLAYGKPDNHAAAMQTFMDQDFVQEFHTS